MNRYRIKKVSEITDFPELTLRYYEKAGLLDSVFRNLNGLQMYEDSHLERVQHVMSSENKLRVQIITMKEQLCHIHRKAQYYLGMKQVISNHEKWKK